jgi:hypothetical protein
MAVPDIVPPRRDTSNEFAPGPVPPIPPALTRRKLLWRVRKLQQQRDALLKDARRYRQRGLTNLYVYTLRLARKLHREAQQLLRQAGGQGSCVQRRVNPASCRRALPFEGVHKEVLP